MRAPFTTGEALAMLHASLDHLARADWQALGGYAQGAALRSLGAAQSKWTVAHAGALRGFAVSGGCAADGHPGERAWLRHQARVTGKAARDLDGWADRLAAHPLLAGALADAEISESWARQFAEWNDRLPAGEIGRADEILLDAARAGLPLRPDIARLAQAIYEAVRGQRPDEDGPDDGFRDRDVRLGTTLGGAGRLTGDLSAECATLLAKVFETFGKHAGREDFRGPGQRNHDALELALRLALGVPDLPRSSGMKSRVLTMLSLAGLMRLDGASALCDAWLAARAGEPGFFSGPAADSAACTGQLTPVITGVPDWDVLSQMADIYLDAHGCLDAHSLTDHRPAGNGDTGNGDSGTGKRDEAGDDHGDTNPWARDRGTDGGSGRGDTASDRGDGGLRGRLSPAARLALERTLLAMSIRALSGPGGLAGFLRANLLGRPFSGKSLILDVGDTDDIPDHLRRAVIARDRHCQWPGGCDRPAAQCEPHHRVPRHQGGKTSLDNLDLYCLVHHHHFIHRLGWTIIRHPDGTRDAVSPDGRVIRSHQRASPAA